VVWLDTAGLRDDADELEARGVALTERIISQADATLVVLDVTPAAEPDRAGFFSDYPHVQPACVALNKCDLLDATDGVRRILPPLWRDRAVAISAAERTGLEQLVERLIAGVGRDEHELEHPAAFTPRQVAHLETASRATDRERFQRCISCCLCEPAQS
jgi:tRNA U34 5-carboxymethylaminomethyl modifying GTPase MnmE/TrmE